MVWDVWARSKEVIAGADSLEALTRRKNYSQCRSKSLKLKVKNGRLVRHRYNTFTDVEVPHTK